MDQDKLDNRFMVEAISEAKAALSKGDVPVGAVLVTGDEIIGRGHNSKEADLDPTLHAEMLAIKQGSTVLKAWRLTGTTLYVTLEPCIMCMGAIVQARIGRLVYGAIDPKAGACGSIYDICTDNKLNHTVEVTKGIRAEECTKLLKDFFGDLREEKKNK